MQAIPMGYLVLSRKEGEQIRWRNYGNRSLRDPELQPLRN